MKELNDGFQVPDYMYYYLLEFNERDCHTMIYKMFKKYSLTMLTGVEFIKLFNMATVENKILLIERLESFLQR